MGKIRQPNDVKLFVGILTSIPELLTEVEARLVAQFGAIDLRCGPFPFDSTRYYDSEMGNSIQRFFLAFSDLIAPDSLAGIKITTNEMESSFAGTVITPRRPVNLDPGYLEQAKLVLASTKNFYHRILLADGIYAEVTLHFENGTWQSFPWTFPDFRSRRYDDFFLLMRDKYRAQLRASCALASSSRRGKRMID
jgi:hypothetical protein